MSILTALTKEQLQNYNQNGYLVLRGLFSKAEMSVLQEECDLLLKDDKLLDPLNLRGGYSKLQDGSTVVERFDPVHDLSDAFAKLVRDERIVGPLKSIYGEEALLFKDKLIFKLPGAGGYTMHQDAAFWQVFPMESLVNVMVAIDGANKENGGLELFPGYHDRFRSTPGELRNMNKTEVKEIDLEKGELVETEPGDIIIFHAFTPHQSGPNTSKHSRRQMYLTYSPARHGDLYKAHYDHYHGYKLAKKDEEYKNNYFFK